MNPPEVIIGGVKYVPQITSPAGIATTLVADLAVILADKDASDLLHDKIKSAVFGRAINIVRLSMLVNGVQYHILNHCLKVHREEGRANHDVPPPPPPPRNTEPKAPAAIPPADGPPRDRPSGYKKPMGSAPWTVADTDAVYATYYDKEGDLLPMTVEEKRAVADQLGKKLKRTEQAVLTRLSLLINNKIKRA